MNRTEKLVSIFLATAIAVTTGCADTGYQPTVPHEDRGECKNCHDDYIYDNDTHSYFVHSNNGYYTSGSGYRYSKSSGITSKGATVKGYSGGISSGIKSSGGISSGAKGGIGSSGGSSTS